MNPAELWSLAFQFLQHLQALITLAVIIIAPVPLSLAFSFAHSGSRPVPLSHSAVVVAVSWLSLQTSLSLVLGVLGRLTLGHVVLAELLLIGLGVLAVFRCGNHLLTIGTGRRRPSTAEAAIIACLATIAIWLLHDTAATPPTEYDSLAYHLPAIANWYRTAGLDMLGQGTVDYYPYNFELVALLFVLPFHGHFAVGLAQILAWSLFGLAIYATATILGAQPLHALVAALLVLIHPLVLRLASSTVQVDLAFAAAFVISIYAALAYVFRASHWSFVVLSSAWLAGVKTSGLVYLLLIVMTILIARRPFAGEVPARVVGELRRPARAVVILSVLMSLMNAGFWYGRNLMTSGNPLGLLKVTLFGFPILHGPVMASELSRSSLAAVFRIGDPGDWVILLKQLAVHFGTPSAVLVIATVMLVAVPSRTTPFWRDQAAVLILVLLILCTAAYIFTPFSGDDVGTYGWRITPWIGQALRYALPAVGVMGVAAALGMARVERFRAALAVIATSAGLLSLPHNRLPGLLSFVAVWWCISRRRPFARWSRHVLIYASVLVVIVSSLLLRNVKDAAYTRMFPAAAYIDRYVPDGEKIGLLVTNRASVFFGSRYTVDVTFVPHGDADQSRWVRALRALDVRFIGVGPIVEDWWLSSNEIRWLGDQECFEKVSGTDYRRGSVLYRVRDSTTSSDCS